MDTVINWTLAQYGAFGVIFTLLIAGILDLRATLRAEREYSQKLNEMYHVSTLKALDTMKNLEQAFVLLRDSLK